MFRLSSHNTGLSCPRYELELTIKWEGQLFDATGGVAAEAKGKIKVPDLSEETYDDLEMTVR